MTLRITGLQFGFAQQPPVLQIDQCTIGQGEFVSIIGPSGCGKSTLLRLIAGLLPLTTGLVLLDDEEMQGRPGHAAYMPQDDQLLPWRRVIDNATLAADVRGKDRNESRAQAQEILTLFGLDAAADAWPWQLSGGMRQRVALARTFLASEELLLLDEPFGALDAITRSRMHQWLQRVLAVRPRTVLFVTHDVDEAILLSDRVLVLSRDPGTIASDIVIGEPRPRDMVTLTKADLIAHKLALLNSLERVSGEYGNY